MPFFSNYLAILFLGLSIGLTSSVNAQSSRPLMDLVDVQGIRENQLVGYGLVVGLDGDGDRNQVQFTSQSITNMLRQFGVQIEDGSDPRLKNVASVSVTASVDPMAGPGQKLNIVVSSIGDAKSLRGGTLLMTPLRGVDGEVYAVAQGNVIVGGFSAEGRSGSSITVNTPTAGRIPDGATLEKEIPSDFNSKPTITLNLKKGSFTTAKNIVRAINDMFGPGVAKAINKGRVDVQSPKDTDQRVVMMSMLEELKVKEGRTPARVVFNSRTGTVVINQSVRVSEAAVSHGNLTVTIAEADQISQPNPLGRGNTERVNRSNVKAEQEEANMFVWPAGTELSTIVDAVNSLGATPDDLMSILQALDEAGALNADLIVI